MKAFRPLPILAICALLCGCHGASVSAHRPESFRADVQRLIKARDFNGAVALLECVDPAGQAAFDKTGFLAVGEDMIVLPGARSGERYDANRDWFIPGTSDAIEHSGWQRTATKFAKAYNRAR